MIRLARKLGVKRSANEATLATLQAAKRLVKDEGYSPTEALNLAADKFSAAKDPAKAFWAAHYALSMAGYTQWLTMPQIEEAEIDVLLPIFDAAIKSQGTMNASVR